MKKPSIRILVSAAAALLLTQLTWIGVNAGLEKFETHKRSRLQEIFEGKSNYDILFLGSSRTHTTIDPMVIDSILGVSSYNAGTEGGYISEFSMTLDAWLINHPPPKLVVLTPDLWSFNATDKVFNYVQYFHYLDNPELNSYMKQRGYVTEAYQMLPFLTLTHLDDYTRFNSIKGSIGKTEVPEGDRSYKGFLSNGTNITELTEKRTADDKKHVTDLTHLDKLEKLIANCKSKNITVLVTYAPEYGKKLQSTYSDPEVFFNRVETLCIKLNVPFLRHDLLEMNHDNRLFANPGHVNSNGANVYSSILAADIDSVLKRTLP